MMPKKYGEKLKSFQIFILVKNHRIKHTKSYFVRIKLGKYFEMAQLKYRLAIFLIS